MATKEIIKPCSNSKGFNGLVFVVHKKNRVIQMVANFKRTFDKVLVDLDTNPVPRINHLLNKIEVQYSVLFVYTCH